MRSGAGVIAAALLIACIANAAAPAPPDPETTYTVRATIRLLNPVNAEALNDPVQTGKIVRKTEQFTDVEFTLYPLLDQPAITGNLNWQKDNLAPALAEFTKPGITSNWDDPMRQSLLREFKADGIDIDALDDKAVVEKVSTWLLKRSHYNDKMFDTWFVDFPNGSPRVLPELRRAFEAAKGDPAWTEKVQFDHELLGRGMFDTRTSGSCTSYAILQATVLKAIGIPTRIVLLTPIVDSNDPQQLDLVRKNIRHNRVRATILQGLPITGDSFTNHTINEVYIGGNWMRLNYRHLGQPILDRHCLGLTVHTNTVNDWSEANYAATWGKRYGLNLRDEVSKTGNPYRAIDLSDHFGAQAKIDNPEVPDGAPKSAIVTRAYWLTDPNKPRSVVQPRDTSNAYLMLHLESAAFDNDWKVLKSFLTAAPKRFELKAAGQATVPATVTTGSYTNSGEDLFDICLKVAPRDVEQMAAGVDYQLSPPDDADGFHWSLKQPLTLAKPAASNVAH
jgi:hypothetical protein